MCQFAANWSQREFKSVGWVIVGWEFAVGVVLGCVLVCDVESRNRRLGVSSL